MVEWMEELKVENWVDDSGERMVAYLVLSKAEILVASTGERKVVEKVV